MTERSPAVQTPWLDCCVVAAEAAVWLAGVRQNLKRIRCVMALVQVLALSPWEVAWGEVLPSLRQLQVCTDQDSPQPASKRL